MMCAQWYYFLAQEVQGRASEPIASRVQYDDFNEFFWSKANLLLLLPPAPNGLESSHPSVPSQAYMHLRNELQAPLHGGRGPLGASAILSQRFRKTYFERVTPLHAFFTYYRVFIFHAVLLHLMIAFAFADEHPSWRIISSATVTHSLLSLLRLLLSFSILPHTSKLDIASKVAQGLGFLCFPGVWMIESNLKWSLFRLSSSREAWTLFEVLAIPYAIMMSWTNLRWTVLLTKRRTRSLVCDRLQVLPELRTRMVYTAFWLLVITLKVWFEYTCIIRPLVAPSRAIWLWGGAFRDADGHRTDFYCWGYNRGGGTCRQDNIGSGGRRALAYAHRALNAHNQTLPTPSSLLQDQGSNVLVEVPAALLALRAWRSLSYRLLILGMRWATPVLLTCAP